MADKLAEDLKVETGTSWTEKKVNTYKNNLEGKDFGNEEMKKDKAEAEELIKSIENAKTPDTTKNIPQEKTQQVSPQVKTAIDALNRPEAAVNIAKSYLQVDTTIKNSKSEKWIAGLLGKAVNRILWQ